MARSKKPSDPWMKFYPSDWRADPALRSCSLAARGLWVECMCIMHEASPYGHLKVNGRPVLDDTLAVLVGCLPDQLPALLGELESAGVFSRASDGTIYSRRMTRDIKKSNTARINGSKGGNKALIKDAVSRSDKTPIEPLDNPKVKDGVEHKDTRSQNLDKKEKKEEPPTVPQGGRRGTGLPDAFPDEHCRELAEAYWSAKGRADISFEDQSVEFRAHHRAHGKASKDWPSSWVTWYRNAIKFNRPPAKRDDLTDWDAVAARHGVQ